MKASGGVTPRDPLPGGRIVGGVDTGSGHKAVGARSAAYAEEGDVLFPSHRDLGAYLVKGLTPERVFASTSVEVGGRTRGGEANLHMGDCLSALVSFIRRIPFRLDLSEELL